MARRGWSAFAIVLMLGAGAGTAAADIRTTKHNLSVSGPGAVKAASETEVCVFCHTPHNASPQGQLWNRNASGASYTPYASTSMNASPGQPTGASKLCLSCHDGTIALGNVLSRTVPIAMAGGVTTLPAGRTRLGADLRDDHPVSFVFSPGLATADGELRNPATLTGAVRLAANGELQCTACHDAHDNTNGFFLVANNTASGVCLACHNPNDWGTSLHRTSTRTWNGTLPDPWPHTPYTTVAANACENCHNPHNAGGPVRLLNYAAEEANCLVCHNTNVATKNINAEFGKASVHPITSTVGVHDSEENALVATRHVECIDCHNPHAVEASGAAAPAVTGALRGVKGIDTDGAAVFPAVYEYQVCYRCHGDSPGKPAAPTPRQRVQTNVRLEFDTAAHSFHPVEGPGRNANVPSLLPPYTTASLMYCTDCHNNDAGPRAGGAGPDGPHGSTRARLLGWRYDTADNSVEGAAAYALCYRCHSRTSILNDQSFKEHRKHIEGERTPCNICHDPHGVSSTQGAAINHSHLINFNIAVVTPSSSGRLEFRDLGTFQGECYLRCHGKDHDPENY